MISPTTPPPYQTQDLQKYVYQVPHYSAIDPLARWNVLLILLSMFTTPIMFVIAVSVVFYALLLSYYCLYK